MRYVFLPVVVCISCFFLTFCVEDYSVGWNQDGGSEDGEIEDAGKEDAGQEEAGGEDAGTADADGEDAGGDDAGSEDAGIDDAVSEDAGSDDGPGDDGGIDEACVPDCQGNQCGLDPVCNAIDCGSCSTWPCNNDTGMCMVDMVPDMTDYTVPSGVAGASSEYSSSYPAWKAFDTDPSGNSMWISDFSSFPEWIAYEFATLVPIHAYAITYSNGGITDRAPQDFTFEGWDGANWVNLDTQTNQTGWDGSETRIYIIANPGDHISYRLYVTAVNGSDVVSMGDLVLLY